MRKGLISGLTIAALATAGCSGVGGGGGDGPVEITFSHWALTAPPFDQFTDIMEDFNASQDDYVVTPENIPYNNYHRTVYTQAGAGEGPTMISVDSSELAQAVDAGLAEDITADIEMPASLSQYEESLEVDGTRHAVTFTRHPYAMLVNTAMLEEIGAEIPETFEDFVDIAEEWTDSPDTYGFAFRHTTADTNGWWLDMSNWIHGSGGYWSDESGPTLDTPEVAEGISRMKEFLDNGTIPEGTDAPTYRRLFWEGKIPFLFESLAFAGIFAAQSEELAENIEVRRHPFAEDSFVSSNNPVFVNASASDEEKEGALEFLNYMLSEDVQQEMVDNLAGSLVSSDLELSEATFENNPWLRGWEAENSGLDFTPPGVGAEFQSFRRAILDQMERIFAGEVSVEEGLAQAQEDAEASLE